MKKPKEDNQKFSFFNIDKTIFKTVLIHFENKQDIDEFAKLINQRITNKTTIIWYPATKIKNNIFKKEK